MSPFARLVQTLKTHSKTVAVVEQSCGGLVQASILGQPGASAVFYGGSVVYNTHKSRPILLNNMEIHTQLTRDKEKVTTADELVAHKLKWSATIASAYCQALGTDYAVAEGGAVGPTYPYGLQRAFSAVSIVGRRLDDLNHHHQVDIVHQQVLEPHTDHNMSRQENMRFFCNEIGAIMNRVISTRQGDVDAGCSDPPPPLVAHHRFDRATHLRRQEAELEQMAQTAQYVVLYNNSILMKPSDEEKGQYQLAFLSQKEALSGKGKKQITFLGIADEKQAIFSVDYLKDAPEPVTDGSTVSLMNTRSYATLMQSHENDIALHATALANWQRRNRYCSQCGGINQCIEGGTCHQCTSCRALSWPRQDPSMICAISSRDGQRLLMAHSKRHPPHLYTVLAGFVEAGERMEDAVAREAYEETGIRIDVDSVQYMGSQPWPFPQSCMLGFLATADDSQTLNVDYDELEDARWFHKEDVLAASQVTGQTLNEEVGEMAMTEDPTLRLVLPTKGVIARGLIDKWTSGAFP